MSLIICKECNKKISKDSKSCPNCGSKKNRTFLKRHPFIAVLLLFFILGVLMEIAIPTNFNKNTTEFDKEDTLDLNVANYQQNDIKNEEKNLEKTSLWNYYKSKDNMRNLEYLFASNRSLNIENLGFPYKNSSLEIIIRNFNKENDVILSVVGIFSCNNRDCIINVKFDDNPIRQYEFSKSNDNDSKVIFINNSNEFIKNLKKSKKVIIEVPLYKSGNIQYSFDVNNFVWNY